MANSWINDAQFYHIYALGFCGARIWRRDEKDDSSHNILKLIDWIPHLKDIGINALYIGPVFESCNHGYDTIDYTLIDKRLGTNDEFIKVCKELKKNDIRIVLDGVFNHVGRKFFAYQDLVKNRENSKYVDWFLNVDFSKNNKGNDGLKCDDWANQWYLLKLNLNNIEVKNHIFSAIDMWIKEFEIDGIRLDAADVMDLNFFNALREHCDSRKKDFWLMGEITHGDCTPWLSSGRLDSVTSYEAYIALKDAFEKGDMTILASSLKKQFEDGGVYAKNVLYSFVDNHDVTRMGTLFRSRKTLKNIYSLMYTMPGVPSIYYGSEWGIKGKKRYGWDDSPVRPCLEITDEKLKDYAMQNHIVKLSLLRKNSNAIKKGDFKVLYLSKEVLIFSRTYQDETKIIAINCSNEKQIINLNCNNKELKLEINANSTNII